MNEALHQWEDALGVPASPLPTHTPVLHARYDCGGYTAELYSCGAARERILLTVPKVLDAPAPAVVVPFYFPEAMLGFDPASGEELDAYGHVDIMHHLSERGYVTVSADAYHLTYTDSLKGRYDFSRWQDAADALLSDHPTWSGMGKLVCDTRRLVDLLCTDPRVDGERIGIAGHSLGGKMAFYTGCLDPRIRAILASDFGFLWYQSNWDADWYWGKRLPAMIARGMDHTALLSAAAKPFCLLAGAYDNGESYQAMCRAAGYGASDPRLGFLHHATGHRPPRAALEKGYDFLDEFLKN